ncbi:hypothetical protein K474DRAFT_30485 [Panus rudis PR-1116 ss-1]|nr:hypothetical protein K474DRAFT_30485 [Panus rudis PR-1116 ss-1]
MPETCNFKYLASNITDRWSYLRKIKYNSDQVVRPVKAIIKLWLSRLREGDLHIIARMEKYVGINVFDMATASLHTVTPRYSSDVDSILDDQQKDHLVYLFPAGAYCNRAQHELETIVNEYGSHNLDLTKFFFHSAFHTY